MFLKPKDGLKIVKPETGLELKKEGEKIKVMTTFWRRRLADGDVVEMSKSQPSSMPKKEEKKKHDGGGK